MFCQTALIATDGPLTHALRWATTYDQAYFAAESLAWLAGVIAVATAALCWWSYYSVGMRPVDVTIGIGLKVVGVLCLIFFILEPMNVDQKPRPGENVVVIVADDSKSLRLSDSGADETRGEQLSAALRGENTWQSELERLFDVRRFQFDTRVLAVNEFGLKFEGSQTAIVMTLDNVSQRLRHRPVAGIVLLTDGNDSTANIAQIDGLDLPPVYPVVIGEGAPDRDLRISRVSVSQTNFEAAPVSILAEFDGIGHDGKRVVLSLIGPDGDTVESQTAILDGSPGASNVVRFQVQPDESGVLFYDVVVQTEEDFDRDADEEPAGATEATLENNQRTAVVDRGGGPYRVLYVAGRPNWEYKYLRRAIQDDLELELVGLLRIARREPKFSFRSRDGESTNPLFRGFDRTDEDTEQYDQPVLLRIDTEDDLELRDGFPKSVAGLYRYDAIILDDTDSQFFTHEQLLLLKRFVSERGGGLFMLGGLESFSQGMYGNTPVEDLLPVYLDRRFDENDSASYRLELTRDGWLQPWVRLRETEVEERDRIANMPAFMTLNQVTRIKPGAEQLAFVTGPDGSELPAMVTQAFGQGRVGAILVGDLWRWEMRRPDPEESDLQTAWRQIVRWLVGDVSRRVEVDVEDHPSNTPGQVRLRVSVKDEAFEPMDNADVIVTLTDPEGNEFQMTAEASDVEAGSYFVDVSARSDGAYWAQVEVQAPDGSHVGIRDAGWSAEPDYREFNDLRTNREFLESLARQTNGRVYELDELDQLAQDLPDNPAPLMETIRYPLWHRTSLFLIAMTCLIAEWGWRRWKGAP